MSARAILLGVWAFAILLAVIGCAPATDQELEPSDGIVMPGPTEAHVVDVTTAHDDGSSSVRHVPNNQILLLFENGVPVETAAATLREMRSDLQGVGLRLVGQIPDLGIYELEIDNTSTDAAASMAALDAVMDELLLYPTSRKSATTKC